MNSVLWGFTFKFQFLIFDEAVHVIWHHAKGQKGKDSQPQFELEDTVEDIERRRREREERERQEQEEREIERLERERMEGTEQMEETEEKTKKRPQIDTDQELFKRWF